MSRIPRDEVNLAWSNAYGWCRRGGLALALLSALGCAPGAVPSQPASSPKPSGGSPAAQSAAGGSSASADWQAQWDKTVTAARQEGKVTFPVQPGQIFRDWVSAFEKAYPGIQVEVTQAASDAFLNKIMPERQAGKYLWDVYIGGADTGITLKPVGALDPFKPALITPEALNDANWLGGFDAGFMDREATYVYDVEADLVPIVYVNRDLVPEAQLSRVEDLVDPKWKGKISMFEPRTAGKGSSQAGHWLMVMGDKGEGFWRQMLQTGAVITEDRRQQLEWAIRGPYPIAVFASNTTILDFQRQSLGLNVKPLDFGTQMGAQFSTSVTLGLINNAPHPNAAKVFLGWLLSKEGQTLYAKTVGQNSRRLDVPDGPSEMRLDPKAKVPPSVNMEVNVHFINRAKEIAKEELH